MSEAIKLQYCVSVKQVNKFLLTLTNMI